MPRTADLRRLSIADDTDNSDNDKGHQATNGPDHRPADATWIFGRKDLIPAAVIFNEWRR